MAMLSGARIDLDGQTYNVVITDDALARIAADGIDFKDPPLRRQGQEMNRYLTVVFAAAAHIEAGGELRWAGISASNVPDMLSAFQGEELFAVVNQAIADWNRQNAVKSEPLPNNGLWN